MGKMIDLGRKIEPGKYDGPETVGGNDKVRIDYPTLRLDLDKAKMFRGKNLGDTCTIVIEAEVVAMREDEWESAVTLDVKKMEYVDSEDDTEDENVTVTDKKKKIANMFKSDYKEDITRIPGQDSKAHKFGQQTASD